MEKPLEIAWVRPASWVGQGLGELPEQDEQC